MMKIIAFTLVLLWGATSSFAKEDKIAELQAQINALADFMEAQSVQQQASTRIGGYGELHYNNLSNKNNEIDMHRFILFVSHSFTENIQFFSELELEHAISGVGQVGVMELEQAYIQLNQSNSSIKVGMFLMPVGIINETHEPPTFYGTERNPIEKYIIPTTWREGGVMYSGQSEHGLSWDLAAHSGLNTNTSVRSGRQNVGKAVAETLAYTGRIKYTGITGLTLSATINQQEDMDQVAGGLGTARLFEAHVIYHLGQLQLTALTANWNIEGGQDTQGSIAEASYKFTPALGVFVRQNIWNDTGLGSKTQLDAGVNYWLHEDVVLKFDIQQQNTLAGNYDGFNLGMGYQF